MTDPTSLLIVEDEPQQRETLAMLFEGEGYRVRSTGSAEAAIDMFRSSPPHLVVTDVKLLGMDGISFFETIRGTVAGRETPFIFMTAYNDQTAIDRVRRMGSVDYITKPFDLEELITLVRERSRP